MAKKRSAPKSGYDFPAKARFRRWAWDWIGGMDVNGNSHTGDVLLMPSTEGREISDEALPRGFTLDQLHVVDRSPAVVATIQRNFPGVHTYGCEVDKAVNRISENGINLIAANVDYCSQISAALLRSIKAVSDSPCCKDAVLLITFLRGREESYLSTLITANSPDVRKVVDEVKNDKTGEYWVVEEGIQPTDTDVYRLIALSKITGRYWGLARPYVSSNGQSFLTVFFFPKGYKPEPGPYDDFRATFEKWAGGDIGDNPPKRQDGESWESFKDRLTPRQMIRLRLMQKWLGVSTVDLLKRYCGF